MTNLVERKRPETNPGTATAVGTPNHDAVTTVATRSLDETIGANPSAVAMTVATSSADETSVKPRTDESLVGVGARDPNVQLFV